MESKRASLDDVPMGDVEFDYENRLKRWVGYINRTRHPRHALDPRIVYGAWDDSLMVGYAAAHHTTKWGVDAELQSMYLLLDYQGRGIGTDLFAKLVAWLAQSGIYSLGVNVFEESPYNGFYLKMGGEATSPGIILWRNLRDWEDGRG